MKTLFSTAAAMLLLATPLAAQQTSQTAIANFVSKDGKANGRAALTDADKGVLIEVDVSDLPPGTWVAFHVHESGKCDHTDGHKAAGAHFNPTEVEHGFLSVTGPHAGDMPNQYVGQDGVMRAQVFNAFVSLDETDNGIRGRALMVHARADDNRSQPAGDAGDRLACAVIE
ncbi:superoxide dismutase family protein [Pararhizobium antarcticum]|uniref:Superoxide dismutase [Cu-Zn] n=1 Tax=Pararhizobium antarcticum TaxID=1798805 RepID=A0A657LQ14_9HYPH|nr:superoxide dismutase family protein [Pararhizobium antarcticum]OJF92901.1 superoxide dismutase [Pararhizobium antarcticum]OJF97746.1 superoxide dismutase [Rhizobium sp. 58]